jgi:hypothetical protein
MTESTTEPTDDRSPGGGSASPVGPGKTERRNMEHRMPDMGEADARNGEPEALDENARQKRTPDAQPETDRAG